MEIQFCGAARTVTGSQYLLKVNQRTLLLECGMYQGKRQESYAHNLHFEFDPLEVDAVILSHAHIDHSGNLPNLVKQGFSGRIYATRATAPLTDVLLQDSAHIQEADAQYVNKKRARTSEPPIEPLYTLEDAAMVSRLFDPVEYEHEFSPIDGVTARFHDAGHILGSAGVELNLNLKENGRSIRLWFSGDVGRYGLPLLRDPLLPEASDYLIMESTYGDKIHRDPELAYDELRQVLVRTFRRRGKVIIPAFSVGRTQEIVYEINRMITSGAIPRIPVFVDSPLSYRATQVFRSFPEYYDEETNVFVQQGRHPALNFDSLKYTESVDDSKAINDLNGPLVIISASGMAETGRILHHLRNNIEDERNTVVIVSWQAPYTLGRRLADRETEVKIFGEVFQRRAEVATIGGLSAHADQEMLLKYALASRSQLRKVFLVHGEAASALPLREKLLENGLRRVDFVEMNQVAELD